MNGTGRTKRTGGVLVLTVVLAVVLGLAAGLGGFTLYYAEGFSYLSDEPEVCVNCHIMREQYAGWQHASHHAAASCNDCHLPAGLVGKYVCKAENGYHHSKAFTLQDFHEPIRIHEKNSRVLNRNCYRCHQEMAAGITAHLGGDLDQLNCVRCHDGVGHGPSR